MVYIIMEATKMEFDLQDASTQKSEKLPHPTLKQVQNKLKGFDESLILYTYHKLNGREEEAASYLAEWQEEQDAIRQELMPLRISLDNIKEGENECISGEHVTSESNHNSQE